MEKETMIGLNSVSWRTMRLWDEVNKKYGDHIYTLGVNGLGEVILAKGYMTEIAIGNKNVQQCLRDLLK